MSKWRPSTKNLLIGGFVIILLAIVVTYVLANFQPKTELHLGSGVFNVQLATTDAERVQGLSGVEKLNANQGLLMAFPNESEWGIWMKDMKIPLDIIWMNNDKKVVYIVNDASPSLGTSVTFTPTSMAEYVLEVPAGTVKKSGIKLGDTATFAMTEAQS